MQIINRDANINGGICYKIASKGRICNIGKDEVLNISASFEELKREGKSISNINDLARTSAIVRQRHLAKMRVLKKEQSGGYILIGSLTCMGILMIGTIIFTAIKFILMK